MAESDSKGFLVAVKTVRTVVCDRCGGEGGTERYGIAFPDAGRRTFDLCPTCAMPLQELADLLDRVGTRGPKQQAQRVMTVEEVERKRRAAKRKARKSG
jgi:hypothetical protein